MIEIVDKKLCCGCEACVQICPKGCITINEDEYGFSYPRADKNECINCSLCEQVCPELNQNSPRHPLKTYAATNKDKQTRFNSSSGGIFTSLAEYVIEHGGIVFGAAFDRNFEVCHISVDSKSGIKHLRGSKYVQSKIGNAYLLARKELKTGRLVLFSGTSCQIAGFKRFLNKTYNNLITVDIVCHGVPSPAVWRYYLDGIKSRNTDFEIGKISFRDKSSGWTNYSLVIQATNGDIILKESHKKNLYMRLFLTNLSIRPSCFNCPAKKGKSASDLTFGDYWGIEKIHPNINDNEGVSLILVNSPKGEAILNRINIEKTETGYSDILSGNSCIEESTAYNTHSDVFWASFIDNRLSNAHVILNMCRPNLFNRLLNKLRAIFD